MAITLTIECEPEDLRDVLEKLISVSGESPVRAPETVSDTWSTNEANRLYDGLQADAKKMISALLSAHPSGLSWSAWQEAVGRWGQDFGGARSSIGHNLRRFPGKRNPIKWEQNVYRLEESFAGALKQALV